MQVRPSRRTCRPSAHGTLPLCQFLHTQSSTIPSHPPNPLPCSHSQLQRISPAQVKVSPEEQVGKLRQRKTTTLLNSRTPDSSLSQLCTSSTLLVSPQTMSAISSPLLITVPQPPTRAEMPYTTQSNTSHQKSWYAAYLWTSPTFMVHQILPPFLFVLWRVLAGPEVMRAARTPGRLPIYELSPLSQ